MIVIGLQTVFIYFSLCDSATTARPRARTAICRFEPCHRCNLTELISFTSLALFTWGVTCRYKNSTGSSMRVVFAVMLLLGSFPALALTDAEVLRGLKDAERTLSAQLPIGSAIGPITSQVIAVTAGPGKRFTYTSVTSVSARKWTPEMRKMSEKIAYDSYCTSSNFSMMKSNDVTVSWVSYDKQGTFLYEHAYSRADCKR